MNSNRPVRKSNSGIIDPEDLAKKGGSVPMGKMHWLRKDLILLKKGELYFIHKNDWNWKGQGNSPARIVRSLNEKKGNNYTISLVGDNSGWVVDRLE